MLTLCLGWLSWAPSVWPLISPGLRFTLHWTIQSPDDCCQGGPEPPSLPRTSRPPNILYCFCVIIPHFQERYYNYIISLPFPQNYLPLCELWSFLENFGLLKFMPFLVLLHSLWPTKSYHEDSNAGSGDWNRIWPYYCFVATWRTLSRLKRQRRMRIQVLLIHFLDSFLFTSPYFNFRYLSNL